MCSCKRFVLLTVFSFIAKSVQQSDSGDSGSGDSGSGDSSSSSGSGFQPYQSTTVSCQSYLDPHIFEFAKSTNRRRATWERATSFQTIGLYDLLTSTKMSVQTIQAPAGYTQYWIQCWQSEATYEECYRKWPQMFSSSTYSNTVNDCPRALTNTVNVGVAVQLESGAKLSFTQLNQASGPAWVHNGESVNEFLPPDPELSLKVDLTGASDYPQKRLPRCSCT